MEIMAFLIGAAARLTPTSAEATVVWPKEALTGGETDRLCEPATRPKDWPGHWAVAKYL